MVILEAMALGLPIITTLVFGIAEQVRPSFNALTYQPGDVRTLARHLALLAEDERRRRSLAAASPWMLRSLPDGARMEEQYRRTFRAAAESALPVPVDRPEDGSDSDATPRRRAWFAGQALRRVTSPRNPSLGTPVER
jgi:hypothetical protein